MARHGQIRARLGYLRRARARKRALAGLPSGNANPLELALDVDSPTLLVAFGGMNRQIGIPPFEFFNLTGGMAVKRAFIRDPRQAWYHRGLPGYGSTLGDVGTLLEDLVAGSDADRVVFAGASAGGYAALVFGSLLHADVVLAFAPQVTLDLRTLHEEIGDHRWDDHLRPLTRAGLLDRRWLHLDHLSAGDYRVYFDDTLQQDRLHAERVRYAARLYRFGAGEHALVRHLRDCGALARILEDATSAALPGPAGRA